MKICFICNEYPPATYGGIGVFTKMLGEALVALGHDICTIGLYYDLEQICEEEEHGVTIYRLPWPTGNLAWWQARRLLWKKIAKLMCNRQTSQIKFVRDVKFV